jgi:hypothetical protein
MAGSRERRPAGRVGRVPDAGGLLHALAVHVEGKGLKDWLVRMAYMVVAGLFFTALAYA